MARPDFFRYPQEMIYNSRETYGRHYPIFIDYKEFGNLKQNKSLEDDKQLQKIMIISNNSQD